MSDVRKRYPDHALERTAGMECDHPMGSNNRFQTYASCGDLQTRHLNRTLGLSGRPASLVAGLLFREVSR